MWQCPACSFLNDAPDAACLRCGAARDVKDQRSGLPDISSVVRSESAPHAKSAGNQRQASGVARLFGYVLVVVLLLTGAVAVIYAAWSRGLVEMPEQLDTLFHGIALRLPEGGVGVDQSPVSEPVRRIRAQEIFEELAETVPRGRSAALQSAVDELAAVSSLLDAVAAEPEPDAQDNTRRAAQLSALGLIQAELLTAYENFESAALKLASFTDAGETVVALRAEFKGEMFRVIDLVGRCYLQDQNVARQEYLMVEQLQQTVAARGRIGADELKERWLAALKLRAERIADSKYTAEYEGIELRKATLYQLRRNFNEAARQLPAPQAIGGRLDPGAVDLLNLYDSFASKLESLWDEWKEFSQTLPPRHDRPARLEEARRGIEELFTSEHLDCYTQMYRIYSTDEALTEPAYSRLVGEHYVFVQAEWPGMAFQYRAVAAQYEAEWDRNFRPNRDRTRGDGSGRGVDLQGPPGYNP
jgi:hypothetical protein